MIKKFSSNLFGFCSQKNESYYPQVFLKEYKYIFKKVIRHIHDSSSDFSYSSDDESDEEEMFLLNT